MNYTDRILLRLMDPDARADIFDENILSLMLTTAYGTAAGEVGGPYTADFAEFQFGFAVPRLGTVEGSWSGAGGSNRTEIRLLVAGLGEHAMVRLDALWRGAILARAVPTGDEIVAVSTTWPALGEIDARIIAAHGNLPPDPAVLEQERREELKGRLKVGALHPELVTDTMLDAWLKDAGAATVGDLLSQSGSTGSAGAVQVEFAPSGAAAPALHAFPITAAVLVRELGAGSSVAELLTESKLLREQLKSQGVERGPQPAPRPRHPILVLWVVPRAVFDDTDWPGGEEHMNPDQLREARRQLATAWLSQEGVVIVPVG